LALDRNNLSAEFLIKKSEADETVYNRPYLLTIKKKERQQGVTIMENTEYDPADTEYVLLVSYLVIR